MASRAAEAGESRRDGTIPGAQWLARCRGWLLAIAAAAALGGAQAGTFGFQPAGPLAFEAAPGTSAVGNLDVQNLSGLDTDVLWRIVSDSTGGARLSGPANLQDPGLDPNGTRYAMNLPSTAIDGPVLEVGADEGSILIEFCEAEEVTTGDFDCAFTAFFQYNVTAADLYQLEFVSPNPRTGLVGEAIETRVRLLRNGVPEPNASVRFQTSFPLAPLDVTELTGVSGEAFATHSASEAWSNESWISVSFDPNPLVASDEIFLSYGVEIANVYTLDYEDPASGSGSFPPLTVVPLSVRARSNGVDSGDGNVDWEAIELGSGVDVTDTLLATISAPPVSGIASTALDDAPAGQYQVTATWTPEPDAPADTYQRVFLITIANTYTLTLQTPPGPNPEVERGTPLRLAVLAQVNGIPAGSTDGLVSWSSDRPGDSSLSPASSTIGAVFTGIAETEFVASAGGTHEVTASWDPESDGVGYGQTFLIQVPLIHALDILSPAGGAGLTQVGTAIALRVSAQSEGLPASDGSSIDWSIVSGPAGGSLPASSSTSGGESEVAFVAAAAGSYAIEARWDPDGSGTAVQTAAFSIEAEDVFELLRETPADGLASVAVGDALEFAVRVRRNGSDVADGLPVAWASSNPAVGSPTALTVTTGGVARSAVEALETGSATITATIDPDGDPAGVADDNGNELMVDFSLSVAAVTRTLEKPPTDSGDGQTGLFGAALPLPLTVIARDNGTPAVGVLINWSTTGDVVLGSSQTTTGPDGSTQIEVTLGSTPGPVTVVAVRDDATAAQSSFVLNVVEGDVSLVRVGERVIGASSGSSIDLEVEARKNGEPESAVPIEWLIESGMATLEPATATGANGRSRNTLTLGFDDEPVSVRVRRGDVAGAETDFFVFNNPILELQVAAGDGASGPGGSVLELAAQALSNGHPLAGVRVEFTVLEGDAELLQDAAISGADGLAAVEVRLGPAAGSVRVRAEWALRPELAVEFGLSNEGAGGGVLGLVLVSGDGQSAVAGNDLPEPLVVEAVLDGGPQAGVAIRWQVLQGLATLTQEETLSAADGRTQVGLRVDAEGSIEVRAERLDAPGESVLFSLVGQGTGSGAPALTLVSGDGQSAAPGNDLPEPLVVEAALDGVPQAGVSIRWQVLQGQATLALDETITGMDGRAQVGLRVEAEGAIEVLAERTDAPGQSVHFSLTGEARADADALTIVSGDDQIGTLTRDGAPLVVRLTRDGVPVEAEDVEWEVLSGDASLPAESSNTDAAGLANIVPRFGTTLGSVLVQARATDAAPVTFNLTAGAPRLRLVSGDGQSGLTGTAAEPIRIELLEACCDTGIAGEPLAWRVLAGDAALDAAASMTDAAGLGSMGFRFGTPGPIDIEVSAFDGLARIELTASSLQPDFRIVSGDDQSGRAGSVLAEDFVVAVAVPGAAKSSLAGIEIEWSVLEGGGTIEPAVSVTDASGQARARYTLGPAIGANRVRAALASGPQLEFEATGEAPDGHLARISGDGQTLPTQADSAPLVVELRDSEGRPLADAEIHWSGENASVASPTTRTDANGRSANTARVLLPGGARVLASAPTESGDEVPFALNGGVANLDGLNPRQREVAEAVDDLCPLLATLTSPLSAEQADLLARCLELVNSAGDAPDTVREALDQLSNDVGNAQATLAFNALRGQYGNIQRRIEARRTGKVGAVDLAGLGLGGGGGVFSLGLLQAEEEASDPAELGADFDRWSFFASGLIGDGRNDPTQASRGFSFQTQGLTAGVDYRVNPQLFLGAALGYNRQDSDFREGRGGLDASGWSLTGYGSWYSEKDWYVDGVLTWGDLDYALRRHIRYDIPALGGGLTQVDQTARADIGGRLTALNLSVGRDFNRGAWGFGSYLRGGLARADVDAYRERIDGSGPGSGLELAVDGRRIDSRTLTLGGRLNYTASRDWGILMPNLQLEWEREFKDDPQRIVSRFLHDPGLTPMLVTGNELDRDYLNLGIGLSAVLPGGRSAYLFYERLMGKQGESAGSLSLGVRIEF